MESIFILPAVIGALIATGIFLYGAVRIARGESVHHPVRRQARAPYYS